MIARSTLPTTTRAVLRYHVRAIWLPDASNSLRRSMNVADLAHHTEPREPDKFGVYSFYAGWIEVYPERAAAERHAHDANGERS